MPSPPTATLDDAVENLYQPPLAEIGMAGEWHERPHKPVLLFRVSGPRVTEK